MFLAVARLLMGVVCVELPGFDCRFPWNPHKRHWGAGFDAVSAAKSPIDLDDVKRRLVNTPCMEGSRLGIFDDPNNLSGGVYEDHIQVQIRVLHPEPVVLFFGEDKEHALVLWKRFTVH